MCYTFGMWEVEFTEEFEAWWGTLDEEEQESLAASVGLVEQLGPNYRAPIRIR
jgi:hypothetical protein